LAAVPLQTVLRNRQESSGLPPGRHFQSELPFWADRPPTSSRQWAGPAPRSRRRGRHASPGVTPAGSERAHPVVARVVLQLGEAERLEQGWQVHPEAPAQTLLQPVPATDRIVFRAAPGLDGAGCGGLLLVGRAERYPITALLQPCMQIIYCTELIAELGRADDADERRRSADSSRYIRYSEVPGGVRRTQGSSLVPEPAAVAVDMFTPLLAAPVWRRSNPKGTIRLTPGT